MKKLNPMSLNIIRKEVLGINARNLDFVYALNDRKLFKNVNDKLITKTIMKKSGIPFPETIIVFRNHRELKSLEEQLVNLDNFVIKPSSGSGGKGILPIRKKGNTLKNTKGSTVSFDAIEEHISDIISGRFSLERNGDAAMFEELIEADETLASISYKGLPDIRIILMKRVPVMGMLRVPTSSSGGKANLHQGAIGAGIDLKTGRLIAAIHKRKYIGIHPDTGNSFEGIQIPNWREIIKLSIMAATAVKLGYVGVDIVIDKDKGPLVLEVNARPGLDIQLACKTGLKSILYKKRSSYE